MCLGMVGEIAATWDEGGMPMASVALPSGAVTACLMYVPDAVAGESVLVHLGFVVDRLDADDAAVARELRAGVPVSPGARPSTASPTRP